MAQKQILNFINGEFVDERPRKTFEKRSPVDNRRDRHGLTRPAGPRSTPPSPPRAPRSTARGAAMHGGRAHRDARRGRRRDQPPRSTTSSRPNSPTPASRTRLASHLDIPRGAANFKIFADVAEERLDRDLRDADARRQAARSTTRLRRRTASSRVICPWNLPLLLMTWKVGPALACGNTVVVKPSEETPLTATLLGEVMNEVGVPKGVYNVVHGFGPDSAGEFLTRIPGVNGITFTGETRTGEAIMPSGRRRHPAGSFELGGKNAGHRLRRLRPRQGDRGHRARVLRQLRPGLPRHRAGLRGAADLRRVRRRA